MSAIISIYGCGPAASIAQACVVCWEGAFMGCFPGGPILCTDRTANAVSDDWWLREEPEIYLAAVNDNAGKVGRVTRYSFGATIRRQN